MTDDIKRLYRSRDDRMIAGVSAGLGEFLQIDTTLVRLVFVLSLFLGGTGLLVYLVMWLVVPEEPLASASTVDAEPAAKKSTTKKSATKKSES